MSKSDDARLGMERLVNSKNALPSKLEGTIAEDSEMPPSFDQRTADGYLGKYILVGITYLDHEGNETLRMQLHGIVEKAAPDGITISLRGGAQRRVVEHAAGSQSDLNGWNWDLHVA